MSNESEYFAVDRRVFVEENGNVKYGVVKYVKGTYIGVALDDENGRVDEWHSTCLELACEHGCKLGCIHYPL